MIQVDNVDYMYIKRDDVGIVPYKGHLIVVRYLNILFLFRRGSGYA